MTDRRSFVKSCDKTALACSQVLAFCRQLATRIRVRLAIPPAYTEFIGTQLMAHDAGGRVTTVAAIKPVIRDDYDRWYWLGYSHGYALLGRHAVTEGFQDTYDDGYADGRDRREAESGL